MQPWAPIANAFSASRKRWIDEPPPAAVYEHIWRLVHLHESAIVTIGVAYATRLLSAWTGSAEQEIEANRLRRQVTGLPIPGGTDANEELPQGRACIDGYIDPWIQLIKDFTDDESDQPTRFCKAVASYFREKPKKNIAFLDAWKLIAELPDVFAENKQRIDRFAAINSLRNTLAHVPIRYRALCQLHTGLRSEVMSLLIEDYSEKGDGPTTATPTPKWFSIFCGCLHRGHRFLSGSQFRGRPIGGNQDDEQVRLRWHGPSSESEEWPCTPFLRVDEEMEASLLFGLDDLRKDPTADDFRGRYYRHAAEMLPVEKVRVPRRDIEPWIPTAGSTATADAAEVKDGTTTRAEQGENASAAREELTRLQPYELRTKADEAFRSRDYASAVGYFDELAQRKGDARYYNDVAKSKHGAALWRHVERTGIPAEERLADLNRSIKLLTEATGHRDAGYRARAYYERSKALWHEWKHTNDSQFLSQALDSATQAARLQYDPAYISWHEKVTLDLDPLVTKNGEQLD